MAVDPLIVSDCTKLHGSVTALSRVSLRVSAGEFCALLGPSGSGKSTLLRLLVGLGHPDEGTISLFGEALHPGSRQRLRRRVGMVHQRFDLVPRLSVRTNILSGAAAGVPLWRVLTGRYPRSLVKRAEDAALAVGLPSPALSRPAQTLSGGQQQRVGLARALLSGPELLLADEPVANLDPALRLEVMTLLRSETARRGMTVVCSLHDAALARTYATHIVALRAGTVVFAGPPEAFTAAQEQSLYAA